MSTETAAKPIAEFIAEHGIAMRATRAERNPHMDNMPGASHWRCTLRHAGRRMVVSFSMGSALSGEPTAADVLDCLASDAASYEQAGEGFEEWAEEYGYDTDSRKAERTFKAVERQAAALRRMLGDELYEALLYETERQ